MRNNGGHLRYRTAILSENLFILLQKQSIELLVFHWLSYDTKDLREYAAKACVPFVYINHFDNKRMSLPETQKCIVHAAGIASVSDYGIPPELRERCVNLSDAVDTEFFTPDTPCSPDLSAIPIVLLPARFQDGKGHCDLIQAASILISRNVDVSLCFTGAVDSDSLHRNVCSAATAAGNLDDGSFFSARPARQRCVSVMLTAASLRFRAIPRGCPAFCLRRKP